jgi:hypothetical protein
VVVPREHDRAERKGREGDEGDSTEQPLRRRTHRDEREGDERDGRDRASPHEGLEPASVLVPRRERRKQESRQGAGRILDAEVAVGHFTPRHRVAELLVPGRIDDLVALVEADVQERPRDGHEDDGEPDGRSRAPAVNSRVRAL